MMDFVSVSFSVVHICQEVVQKKSVLEWIDGGRLHNMRRKSVPVIDNSFGEEVSLDF